MNDFLKRNKIWIAEKYLDILENLPKFQGGPIAHSQSIRNRQRKESNDLFETSKPVDGSELKFLFHRMVEIYSIEDLSRVFYELSKFRKNKVGKSAYSGLEDRFVNSSTLSIRSYTKIGTISRKNTLRGVGSLGIPIEKLNSNIEFIDLQILKILPSTFILVIDIVLSDEANDQLKLLQRKKYLPEIEFHYFIPFPLGWRGVFHSSNTSKAVLEKTIDDWYQSLQLEVERMLKPVLRYGLFSQMKVNSKPKLPALKVFVLDFQRKSNLSLSIEDMAGYQHWLNSVGINIRDFDDIYSDGRLIFSERDVFYSRKSMFDRLLVNVLILKESFLDDKNHDMYSSEKLMILTIFRDELDSFMPIYACSAYLKSLDLNIANLRDEIFTSLKARWWTLLNPFAKNENNILLESSFFFRFKFEVKNSSDWFHHEVETFKKYRNIGKNSSDDESLGSEFESRILNFLEWYDDYFSTLREISGHLTGLRNIQLTFRIGLLVLIFTALSLIWSILN